jgi:hypothetical protein
MDADIVERSSTWGGGAAFTEPHFPENCDGCSGGLGYAPPPVQETATCCPNLRPYQEVSNEAIRDAFRRDHRRVLFILPTGGGKTIQFCFLTVAARQRGKRVLILVHRQELITQTALALQRFGVEFGVIAPGHPPTDAPVQIASVMTLVRRLDGNCDFDLVVVDEAHHSVAGPPAALGRMPYHSALAWAGRDRDRLRRVQIARGYHWRWIDHILREGWGANH